MDVRVRPSMSVRANSYSIDVDFTKWDFYSPLYVIVIENDDLNVSSAPRLRSATETGDQGWPQRVPLISHCGVMNLRRCISFRSKISELV